MSNRYRSIPSVERLLSDARIGGLIDEYSREPVVYLARRRLEEVRQEIGQGKEPPSFDDLVEGVTLVGSAFIHERVKEGAALLSF